MSGRNLISIADLTNGEIEEIFELADAAEKLRADKPAHGRIMATLFYEPSTRTRLSFESAMHRLGGSVISCSDMKSSSTAKETVADVSGVELRRCLVVRHCWDGAVRAMAERRRVVINAGDGSHEHPSQTPRSRTLKKAGRQGLDGVICGDPKTAGPHSLVTLGSLRRQRGHSAPTGWSCRNVLERLERERLPWPRSRPAT
jgi:aspartate carbamoyltransferase catalytic subunit